MNKPLLIISSLALTLLSACGKSSEPAASNATPETKVAANTVATADDTQVTADTPPASAAQCVVCHKFTPDGMNGVGPNLHGIVGKKAASIANFTYSDAMKNSGLTWDKASLEAYLTNPMKAVPGTRMAFAGISDATKRAEVIAYLESLK
jgi:cytochrome c